MEPLQSGVSCLHCTIDHRMLGRWVGRGRILRDVPRDNGHVRKEESARHRVPHESHRSQSPYIRASKFDEHEAAVYKGLLWRKKEEVHWRESYRHLHLRKESLHQGQAGSWDERAVDHDCRNQCRSPSRVQAFLAVLPRCHQALLRPQDRRHVQQKTRSMRHQHEETQRHHGTMCRAMPRTDCWWRNLYWFDLSPEFHYLRPA